jgi:hypothetical protein
LLSRVLRVCTVVAVTNNDGKKVLRVVGTARPVVAVTNIDGKEVWRVCK